MTVVELISALNRLPPHLTVVLNNPYNAEVASIGSVGVGEIDPNMMVMTDSACDGAHGVLSEVKAVIIQEEA